MKATIGQAADSKCVLVVDDEPSLLEFFNVCLPLLGYSVEVAENGAEAMKMARRRKYGAVITDIRMPEMDGVDFYENLKDISPGLAEKVIFTSGYMKPEHESFVRTTGRPFLLKPFQLSELSQVLDNVITGHTTA